jgi:anti-sigma factor RsiW
MTVPCDDFQALGAELALGILDRREGAEVLAHAATCPACAKELVRLGALVAWIVSLSPPAEPPVDFEIRVLSSLAQARASDDGDALSQRGSACDSGAGAVLAGDGE